VGGSSERIKERERTLHSTRQDKSGAVSHVSLLVVKSCLARPRQPLASEKRAAVQRAGTRVGHAP
jgi:hypothetical protein